MAYDNRYILDEVYQISNAIWDKFQFVMAEEFAFSYVLKKENIEIRDTSDYVIHYYALKWVRILAAIMLDCYVAVDELIADQFMKVLKYRKYGVLNIKKFEIAYLVSYILKSINMTEWKLGFVELSRDRTLIHEYRMFISMFDEYNDNDKDEIYSYLLGFIDEN